MARALTHRNYHTCAHTQLTEEELKGGRCELDSEKKNKTLQAFDLHKELSCITSCVFSTSMCVHQTNAKCRRWELGHTNNQSQPGQGEAA